jgi:hypothetical protein
VPFAENVTRPPFPESSFIMRLTALAPLWLATLLLGGCAGYTLGPIKPTPMKEVRKLAVHSFTNETLEPRLEMLMANSIIKQIQQDGTYQIVAEKDADAILQGNVTQIDRRPSRGVNGNILLAREYTLTVRARYVITQRSTGLQLAARSVTGATSFFVSGSSSIKADVNQDERQAIPLAAEDLAVRLVSQISEGW